MSAQHPELPTAAQVLQHLRDYVPAFIAETLTLTTAEYSRRLANPPQDFTNEQWDNYADGCQKLFLVTWYLETQLFGANDDTQRRTTPGGKRNPDYVAAAHVQPPQVDKTAAPGYNPQRVPFWEDDISNECPHCGNGIWRDENWCDQCGATLENGKWSAPTIAADVFTQRCPDCDNRLQFCTCSDDDYECPICGVPHEDCNCGYDDEDYGDDVCDICGGNPDSCCCVSDCDEPADLCEKCGNEWERCACAETCSGCNCPHHSCACDDQPETDEDDTSARREIPTEILKPTDQPIKVRITMTGLNLEITSEDDDPRRYTDEGSECVNCGKPNVYGYPADGMCSSCRQVWNG